MNYEKIIKTKILELQQNGAALSLYAAGKENLLNSTVLDILALIFRPASLLGAVNPQENQAISGAYSAGAQDMLRCLIYFKEMYLETIQHGEVPRMDFNSLELAVQKGTLTKEEADAIRHNKSPDYSKFIKPASSGNTTK